MIYSATLLEVKRRINPYAPEITVCEEWLHFSAFKAWMQTQEWEDKILDRTLYLDHTHYSPDTCVFLHRSTHSLLERRTGGRILAMPTGVEHRPANPNIKFFAAIGLPAREFGGTKRLGGYRTVTEAMRAYLAAKVKMLEADMRNYPNDIKVQEGLRNYQKKLVKDFHISAPLWEKYLEGLTT